MNPDNDNPFASEEPEWLKEAPRAARPIGDAFLPHVDAAVAGLTKALRELQEVIVCEVKDGCSLDTATRLLAAYQQLEGLKHAEERLGGILYNPDASFFVGEEANPF